MTKIISITMFLIFTVVSYSQTSKEARQAKLDAKKSSKKVSEIFRTKNGYEIAVGQDILIGVGSTPDGDFKFIRRNSSSLFAYYSTNGNQAIANSANAFPRSQSGYKYIVKAIERRGDEKHGYVTYLKIGSGIVNYEIDIENAISSGEIVVPDQFLKNEKNVNVIPSSNTFSVADELIKLKKLLDEGILSQEEFDSQKKKLLER
jgi:hypothetical protein